MIVSCVPLEVRFIFKQFYFSLCLNILPKVNRKIQHHFITKYFSLPLSTQFTQITNVTAQMRGKLSVPLFSVMADKRSLKMP